MNQYVVHLKLTAHLPAWSPGSSLDSGCAPRLCFLLGPSLSPALLSLENELSGGIMYDIFPPFLFFFKKIIFLLEYSARVFPFLPPFQHLHFLE